MLKSAVIAATIFAATTTANAGSILRGWALQVLRQSLHETAVRFSHRSQQGRCRYGCGCEGCAGQRAGQLRRGPERILLEQRQECSDGHCLLQKT